VLRERTIGVKFKAINRLNGAAREGAIEMRKELVVSRFKPERLRNMPHLYLQQDEIGAAAKIASECARDLSLG
jgi:hypothetical protein